MNTRIFTTGALACAVFLAGAAQAAEQAADPYPPVKFDLPEHQAFVDSLKLDPARHQGPQTKEEIKAELTKIFNEKTEQHALTKHYEKGLTCVACHMPNIPSPEDFTGPDAVEQYYSAVRRSHLYRINTDPTAQTLIRSDAKEGSGERLWTYALDKKGHAYVDIVWSCGRATPGDYTLSGALRVATVLQRARLTRGCATAVSRRSMTRSKSGRNRSKPSLLKSKRVSSASSSFWK